MSALPLQLAAPSRPIDWSAWVPLDVAAKMLGRAEGTLRAQAPQLAVDGTAIKAAPPGESRQRWWIARSYLPADEDAGGGASVADTLKALSARNRDLVLQRRACLDRFREMRSMERRPVKAWLPGLVKRLRGEFPDARVSRSHLYAWDKQIKTDADTIELADFRGGDRSADLYVEFKERFRLDFLDARKPTAKQCYERTRIELLQLGADPRDIPSLRTLHRKLDEWYPPHLQAFHRDKTLYKNQYLGTIKQDDNAWAAGRRWVFDHTICDFWCRYRDNQPFRPWLTTAQDWRTQKIVAYCLSPAPNSDTILYTLREGMLDSANMGGPEEVCFDNGKDFDSWFFDRRTKQMRKRRLNNEWLADSSFRGIFGHLKIEPHFAIPLQSNGKSRQERWYGFLHDHFCRNQVTYCGKDVLSKPHELDKRLDDPAQVPSYESVLAGIDQIVTAYNLSADHQIESLREDGLPLSPAAAMAQWCEHVRVYDRGALDLLLMHHDRPSTVRKQGVGVTIRGSRLYFGLRHGVLLPELLRYQGTKRKVRAAYDPASLAAVHVYDDATGQLLCIAPNNLGDRAGDLSGGVEHVAAAHRAIRQHHKELKRAGLGRLQPKLSPLVYRLLNGDLGDLGDVPEPVTRSIKPVRTGFEEAAQLADRHRFKLAVGAEHSQDPAHGRPPQPIDHSRATPARRTFNLVLPDTARMSEGGGS